MDDEEDIHEVEVVDDHEYVDYIHVVVVDIHEEVEVVEDLSYDQEVDDEEHQHDVVVDDHKVEDVSLHEVKVAYLDDLVDIQEVDVVVVEGMVVDIRLVQLYLDWEPYLDAVQVVVVVNDYHLFAMNYS